MVAKSSQKDHDVRSDALHSHLFCFSEVQIPVSKTQERSVSPEEEALISVLNVQAQALVDLQYRLREMMLEIESHRSNLISLKEALIGPTAVREEVETYHNVYVLREIRQDNEE